MFTSFEEPDLASRARGFVWPPAGAYIFLQVYVTVYPLLGEVPRWLFEGVRLVLFLGTAGGIGGILSICYRGVRERRWTWAVTFWLSVILIFVLLSADTLYWM